MAKTTHVAHDCPTEPELRLPGNLRNGSSEPSLHPDLVEEGASVLDSLPDLPRQLAWERCDRLLEEACARYGESALNSFAVEGPSDLQIAVHEAGHALIATAVGISVDSVGVFSEGGGYCECKAAPDGVTPDECVLLVACTVAGRCAEEVCFGNAAAAIDNLGESVFGEWIAAKACLLERHSFDHLIIEGCTEQELLEAHEAGVMLAEMVALAVRNHLDRHRSVLVDLAMELNDKRRLTSGDLRTRLLAVTPLSPDVPTGAPQ